MMSYYELKFIEVVFQLLAKIKSKWYVIRIGYLAAILKRYKILFYSIVYFFFQNYDFL